jgi:alpha,alpha-trehalase
VLVELRGPGEPHFSTEDYLAHVDGRPRYDGVAGFLASRGIELPRGVPSDPPGAPTICGLGNRKNTYFRDHLAEHGVEPYDTTLVFVAALRSAGVAVAAVSASENQLAVLEAAGAASSFDARVDGVISAELGLAGKPDPALFLEAARRLGVDPRRCAVVEDARSGVEAGRRGGFSPVVGVDRTGRPAELVSAGADVVVADLVQLGVTADRHLMVEDSGAGTTGAADVGPPDAGGRP